MHDPGTRRGEDMRYPSGQFMDALGDYASGRYVAIPAVRQKNVIIMSH